MIIIFNIFLFFFIVYTYIILKCHALNSVFYIFQKIYFRFSHILYIPFSRHNLYLFERFGFSFVLVHFFIFEFRPVILFQRSDREHERVDRFPARGRRRRFAETFRVILPQDTRQPFSWRIC